MSPEPYSSYIFVDMVSSQLENIRHGEVDDWLESLIEALQKQSLSSNVLDLKSVRAALKDLQKDGGIDDTIVVDANSTDVNEEPFISVIDAFQVPRFMYDTETEKYKKTGNQALLGMTKKNEKISQKFSRRNF